MLTLQDLRVYIVVGPVAVATGWLIVRFPSSLLIPATAAAAVALAALLLAWGARRQELLSPPVLVGVPLLLGLAAAMAPITKTHWEWNASSLAGSWGIALAPLAGMAGVALALRVGVGRPPRSLTRDDATKRQRDGTRYAIRSRDGVAPPDPALLVRTLLALVLGGVAVQLYEFARFGVIPLFSSAIDASRIGLQHPGPLYLLSDGLLLSAIVASWARFGWSDRFSVAQRRILTAIVLFVPAFLTLQGGRFVASAPAIAALIAARPYLTRRVVRRVGLAAALIGLVLSIGLLSVRFIQASQQNPLSQRIFLTASGASRSLGGVLWNGLLINLGEGYRVADEFRHSQLSLPIPSTSVYFAHSGVPSAQDPQKYALQLSDLWVTSTYAGPLILDLGAIPACLFGFALGALLQFVYVRRAAERSPFFWWLYPYLAANFAFLFYVELPSLEPYLWIDPFVLYGVYRFLFARSQVRPVVRYSPRTGAPRMSPRAMPGQETSVVGSSFPADGDIG